MSEVTPAGVVSTFASGFDDPVGLAFDSAGNLYVANAGNDTVSKVTPAGVVSTFASGFDGPDGLAFDSAGNLYVANLGSNTVSEVTPAGVVSTFASGFNSPDGLAFDRRQPLRRQRRQQHGEQGQRNRDRAVHARRHRGLGHGLQRRHGQSADLRDRADHPGHHRHAPLRPRPQPDADIDPGHAHGRRRPGQSLGQHADHHEPEPAVQFSTGSETVNESAGTFSIPVTALGHPCTPTVFTFASGFNDPDRPGLRRRQPLRRQRQRQHGERGDARGRGQHLRLRVQRPVGLAFDAAGNLYVANSGDNTVSEVTPAGGGQHLRLRVQRSRRPGLRRRRQPLRRQHRQQHGERGDARGGGQHLRLRVQRSLGLAFDSAGNLYVANVGNDTVSEVTPAGAVSTFASGFDLPDGLAFDSAGNLYVANVGNNTVSEVTPAGAVSTFASGFNGPVGLAFDAGNLYVANIGNNTVSEVSRNRDRAVHARRDRGLGHRLQRRHGQSADVRDRADHPGHHRHAPLRPRPQPDADIDPGHAHGGRRPGQSLGQHADHHRAGGGDTTPTPTSALLVFIGEQRVFSGKGKHKKLVGFEFLFNGALNAGGAQSTGDYHVTQKHGKKVKVLPVKSALYNPSNFSVTISVGGFKTGKAAQVTIAGLAGADGAAIPADHDRPLSIRRLSRVLPRRRRNAAGGPLSRQR